MKISIKTWLAVLSLVMGGITAGLAQSDDTKLVIALSQPGKPGLLKVNLLNGSIKVTGYNGKDVVLTYSGRENRKLASQEESGGLRRLSGNSIGLEAQEESNTVTIKTSSLIKTVDLEIKVPHDFSVKLKTLNDGQIVVQDVNGEIDVDNLNGGINLENVSGSASASTLNGNIIASFRKVTPNMPMAFSNLNGKIDVTLPPTAKFNAKLKSDNGDVFTDFDLAMEKDGKPVQKVKEGQGQKIYLDRWMSGKINGGGPEMLFKNFNGNIYIRKSK
jgi:DUF4097 and DUF4098 domain-containing protein YvlB